MGLQEFQPHTFEFVWCSPPCAEYSVAKTVGKRRVDEANAIVRRTLEIVRYFDPPCWAIENPQSGHLKRQEFMADLLYHDLDYCCYGMPYRKRTRLLGSLGVVDAEAAMQVGLSICRRRAALLHGAAAVERRYAAQVARSLSCAQSTY